MKITVKEIKQIIKEEAANVLEMYDITDLGDIGADAPMTDKERMMDQWTTNATKSLFDSILVGTPVNLPTGKKDDLDGFLATLGNMVVTGGISNIEAMRMIRQLGSAAGVAMSRVSADFVDEDYIEDQKFDQGEGDYSEYEDVDLDLAERKLTDAEEDKREKVAKAIEKDNPKMPMGNKMAIATAQAKKSA